MRRIHAGVICCECSTILQPRRDGGKGERRCLACIEIRLVPVVMAFHVDRGIYCVSFYNEDGSPLPWTGRYRAHDKLYAIARASYQPTQAERELESRLKHGRGGRVTLRLTWTQFERLKAGRR